jgi:EmrB/QacA subfamily drug resistance transporter
MLRPSDRTRCWWVVAAMAIVMLPISIDSFGLVVALPSVASSFSATTSELAWVLNMAILFFGAGAMVLGRLSDILGRRRLLIASMTVLAVASVGCALAPSVGVLIGFRALEGVGMSGTYAASFPIVSNAFAPERRSVGLGMWAAGFMLGNVIGGPLAGWFSESLSWRWLFWLNLPLLAAGLAITLFAVEESRDESASRSIDWFGVVTPTLALLCLLFGLQSANELGWGSPAVAGSLGASALLLAVFLVYEPKRPEPLIDFALFRNRTYWSATTIGFAGNFGFALTLFFTPLYLQVALGYTPAHAGIVLLAYSVPCFLVSAAIGPICDRYGARAAMVAGMVLLAAGAVAYAFVSPSTGVTLVVVVAVVGGIGTGGAFNGSNISGVSAVAEEKVGAASGVLGQIRLLGQTLGVTLGLVVFNTFAERRLNDLAPGDQLTHAQVHDVHGLLAGSQAARQALAHDTPPLARHVQDVVTQTFVAGLRSSMILTAAVCLCGVAAAIATPRTRAVVPMENSSSVNQGSLT